jgi:hypothetical protein
MNYTNLFEREVFECWLSQQPDDREWVYQDCDACVCSTFAMEMRRAGPARSDPCSTYVGGAAIKIPAWLCDALWEAIKLHNDRSRPGPAVIIARDLKRILGLTESQEPTPTTDEPHAQTQTQEAKV